MTLSEEEVDALQSLLDSSPWNNTFNYGIINNDPLPCKRIKNASYKADNPVYHSHHYGSSTIFGYQAAFLVEHQYIPTQNLSHICGNVYNSKKTTCVEGSHIEEDDQEGNMIRRSHHTKIREWEKSNRHLYQIIGPLYLSDIEKIEKLKITQSLLNLRRSKRLKRKNRKIIKHEQLENQHINVNQSFGYDICTCTPNCFINYHKLN